jgi:hypothetical protein
MELLESLLANPIILGIVIILTIVFVYGLVKRLFKMALLILLILAGTIFWFKWTGQEIPADLEDISKKSEKVMKQVVEEGGKLIKEGSKIVKKKLDDNND